MIQIGALGFASPWLLLGLLVLPILWWLLRATPPAPLRERFPGVVILLGLEPPEKTPERTPWWLLLLRLLIAGLAILAFAQPLLNPRAQLSGEGPLRVVLDGGWASASDWDDRLEAASEVIDRAARAERPVQLMSLTEAIDAERVGEVLSAADARERLEGVEPNPWAPDRAALLQRLSNTEPMETVWLSDGLDHGNAAPLADALVDGAPLHVILPETMRRAVLPGSPEEGGLGARVLRAAAGAEGTAQVLGYSAAEDGARKVIALAEAAFEEDAVEANARFDVPLELRNRIAMLGLEGARHAAATALIDARWRRKKVGLISGERPEGNQRLLSGAHYIRNALETRSELREGQLADLMEQDIDTLILLDIGDFAAGEREVLTSWVEGGGLLVRFAGPSLAATTEEQRFGFGEQDTLLPVKLRPGGRDLGGAMSWGAPQRLAPFGPDSPFAGLTPPEDARVAKQVLAEPDIDLPTRTWAALTDGAPLVTSDRRGDGRIVLVHTTADPRWTTLPLSGLFLEMLDRILKNGVAAEGAAIDNAEGLWQMVAEIGADGALRAAPGDISAIDGALIGQGGTREAPPGLYRAASGPSAGALRAHNLLTNDAVLTPLPDLPEGVGVETLGTERETPLKPLLLALALALLVIDAVAAFALAGKLRRPVAVALVALFALSLAPDTVRAEDDKAIRAALDGALGYVVTRDAGLDEITRAGLQGLSNALIDRTSVEPPPPIGVDIETDELAVYPILYWAISSKQPKPSSDAIGKLNEYMRQGGLLVMDTRDQNVDLGTGSTPGTRALQRLTQGLDLPPLSPIPEGHVLGRSFYLLDDFPGRWTGGRVWVEAAPPEDLEEVAAAGTGFKNDGVSPILVGGRDWAGAWAETDDRKPMLPVNGRGETRQRELAIRFGVNLVMYAYSGSYKSDQVHIPALLQRLGQ